MRAGQSTMHCHVGNPPLTNQFTIPHHPFTPPHVPSGQNLSLLGGQIGLQPIRTCTRLALWSANPIHHLILATFETSNMAEQLDIPGQ
jgi:hypothetical protein